MNEFLCGVIEGFYGREWPWSQRRTMIEFLQREQFNTYVYAPKSDRYLRRAWRELHDAEAFSQLTQLRTHCRAHAIQFGIGFSPWGLQAEYSAADRAALRNKITHLNTLDTDIFCILFDDMPGAIVDLAQRQLAIIDDVLAWSNARRFIVCPTYYSFDPVLEKVFGAMPVNYLETLGAQLPKNIDLFWTGSQVVAPGFTKDDIDAIAQKIQRKPLLWDNYPVNDGAKISRFLHLLPPQQRPWQLHDWCSGHLANPMNQPLLSQLPLAALARNYREREQFDADNFWRDDLEQLIEPTLAQLLRRDAERFQQAGLDRIDADERQRLLADYRQMADPAALEVIEWLQERYRFDPACLTD